MTHPLHRLPRHFIAPVEVPVGSVTMYAGPVEDVATQPGPERIRLMKSGWLVCDGIALPLRNPDGSHSVYRALFQVIGNTYGGDGKTGFHLPDYRGYFFRGRDFDNGTQPYNPRDPDWKDRKTVGSTQDTVVQTHGHDYLHLSPDGPITCVTGEGETHLGAVTCCATKYGAPEQWADKQFTETRPINISINLLIKFTPLVGHPENALMRKLGLPATPWSLLGFATMPQTSRRQRE
jgi:hypothetical protein